MKCRVKNLRTKHELEGDLLVYLVTKVHDRVKDIIGHDDKDGIMLSFVNRVCSLFKEL